MDVVDLHNDIMLPRRNTSNHFLVDKIVVHFGAKMICHYNKTPPTVKFQDRLMTIKNFYKNKHDSKMKMQIINRFLQRQKRTHTHKKKNSNTVKQIEKKNQVVSTTAEKITHTSKSKKKCRNNKHD